MMIGCGTQEIGEMMIGCGTQEIRERALIM
jgi:hypothetical protein